MPPRRPPAWREVPAELRERVDALLADAGAVPELGPSRAWAAFVVVWGRQSAPLPRWRWEQLRRVLRRLDRYAAHGRGQAGAGIGVLVDLMLAHRLELPWEPSLPAPASLAYFLPELERISRKWRRDQDPERRRRSAEHRARRGHRYERQGRELRKRGRRRGR